MEPMLRVIDEGGLPFGRGGFARKGQTGRHACNTDIIPLNKGNELRAEH